MLRSKPSVEASSFSKDSSETPTLSKLLLWSKPLPPLATHSSGSGQRFPGSLPAGLAGSDTWSIISDPQQITRFVLFDFTVVSGLDATAARSCFLNLTRTLTPPGLTIVFGGVKKGSHVERLLIGHEILEVPPPGAVALRFDTIDEALEYCEDELLRAGPCRDPTRDTLASLSFLC